MSLRICTTIFGLAAVMTVNAQQREPWLMAAVPEPEPQQGAVMAFQMSPSGSFLGIGIGEINADRAKELKLAEERGVEVTSIFEDSPAQKAGLQKGDVILEFSGQRVEGMEQLIRLVRETPPGRQVKIAYLRGGSARTATATIGSRKTELTRIIPNIGERLRGLETIEVLTDIPRMATVWRVGSLGVDGETLDGQFAEFFGVKSGVLIRSVNKDSAAAKAGLRAGDVITKLDGAVVESPRELGNLLRKKGKETASVTYTREKRESSVSVTPDLREDRFGPSRKITQSGR